MISFSAICYPIAIFLWAVGLLLLFGLPNYYRQTPGKVASFYKSVFRRKIVLWNFVAVILQNFFLSAPYGRNWGCKSISSRHILSNWQANSTLQSFGLPTTLRPGKSSSYVSSSTDSSGRASCSSSAAISNPTVGSCPCLRADSGRLASYKSGGVSRALATSFPGSPEAISAELWPHGVSGSGWVCWIRSRVLGSVLSCCRP